MRLVIDTGHVAHRLRQLWHLLRLMPVKAGKCAGCGKPLSAEERHFYEVHCERCAPMFMWDGE